MMGERSGSQQWSLVEGFLGRPIVPEDSIYHLVADADAAQFEDAAFAGMYTEQGRPSYPPSLMIKVLLLAFHDKAADRETEERCRFDLRWKYALGLGMTEDGTGLLDVEPISLAADRQSTGGGGLSLDPAVGT